MADFFANRATPGAPARYIETGVIAQFATYEHSGTFEGGDRIFLMRIPRLAIVHSFTFGTDGLETGGTTPPFAFDLGDSLDSQRYTSGIQPSNTSDIVFGITSNGGALGFQYDEDDFLIATVAQIGNPAPPDPIIKAMLLYFCDN